jgi:hypothetical protein
MEELTSGVHRASLNQLTDTEWDHRMQRCREYALSLKSARYRDARLQQLEALKLRRQTAQINEHTTQAVEGLKTFVMPMVDIAQGRIPARDDGASDGERLRQLRLAKRVVDNEISTLKEHEAVRVASALASVGGEREVAKAAHVSARVSLAEAKRKAKEEQKKASDDQKKAIAEAKSKAKQEQKKALEDQKKAVAEAKKAEKAEKAATAREAKKKAKDDQKKAKASIYKNGCIVLGDKHLSSKIDCLEVLAVKLDEEGTTVIEASFKCSSKSFPETGEVTLTLAEFRLWPLALRALAVAGHDVSTSAGSA